MPQMAPAARLKMTLEIELRPSNIDDGGHHGDVFSAQVVGGVATSEGGDHQLGKAYRQGAHSSCA